MRGTSLVSAQVAKFFEQVGKWEGKLRHIGPTSVKHDVELDLYNLWAEEVGNPRLPEVVREKRRQRVFVAAMLVLFTATVLLVLSSLLRIPVFR